MGSRRASPVTHSDEVLQKIPRPVAPNYRWSQDRFRPALFGPPPVCYSNRIAYRINLVRLWPRRIIFVAECAVDQRNRAPRSHLANEYYASSALPFGLPPNVKWPCFSAVRKTPLSALLRWSNQGMRFIRKNPKPRVMDRRLQSACRYAGRPPASRRASFFAR